MYVAGYVHGSAGAFGEAPDLSGAEVTGDADAGTNARSSELFLQPLSFLLLFEEHVDILETSLLN